MTEAIDTKDKSFWKVITDWWTPYRLASVIFFMLFAGADVSLFLFGRSATGNVFIALVLTLLSGVGALAWKRQRDHKNSNDFQRSIALTMIIIHAIAAVIFMGGNFGKDGWEALSGSIKINGQIASEMLDYMVLIQKVFTWSIVVMLCLDMIALFVFMEFDTEKKHERMLARITRDDKEARIKAQEIENKKASAEYIKYSGRIAEIKALTNTRQRLIDENAGLLDENTMRQSLADLEDQINLLTGAVPIDPNVGNSEAIPPFGAPPRRSV